jgi:mono/diheme cytochrome c family protein
LILAAPVFTLAAEKSIGQREYEVKCVMCHGVAGKGDGWLSDYMKTRPTSLTQLKKNNGGVFPFDRAYGAWPAEHARLGSRVPCGI